MREVPGMYIPLVVKGQTFGHWYSATFMTRGLKDILVACTDNLKSFTAAIPSVYPKAEVQSCIVHQVRNPLKYVTGKHQKRVNEGFKTGLPCRYSLQIGTRKIRFNDLKFIGQPIFKPLLFP